MDAPQYVHPYVPSDCMFYCVLYQIPLTLWSQMTSKDVVQWVRLIAKQHIKMSQCVEVCRNFVHSYSVNCSLLLYSRTLEGQAFIQEPECSPPPPKPLHKHKYICRHTVTGHSSHLTNKVLWLHALIIACNGVHCGLKYQHWPMKQTAAVDLMLSVAYCTHTIQTKLTLKNQRYPQK